MKRATLLLAILAGVLIVVLWYLLLWSPAREELATTEDQIALAQTNQTTVQARITALQDIRERAPQIQADVAATETILPRDTALPSALRQLQQAADESGAVLVSVSPSRPTPVLATAPTGEPATSSGGLHQMDLNLEVRGGYFQLVDTLRRLEDPAISSRGIVWSNLVLTIDEYPTLTATMTGRMFAILPSTPEPGLETVVPGEPVEGDTTGEDAVPETTPADPAQPATPDVTPAPDADEDAVIQ